MILLKVIIIFFAVSICSFLNKDILQYHFPHWSKGKLEYASAFITTILYSIMLFLLA